MRFAEVPGEPAGQSPAGRLKRQLPELDAVTVDGFGTLVELVDPAPALQRALQECGVERAPGEIAGAFAAEATYYRARSHRGRDTVTLAALRAECAGVFLRTLGIEKEVDGFTNAFVSALRFRPVEGAVETLRRLRAHGLALAVVANWDVGLHDHLAGLGISPLVDTVVTSAEAGAAKPDPAIFLLALERLAVDPARALHVGDEPLDEEGARAAGMRFAPAPLRSLL